MKENIFCPECTAPLFRSLSERDYDKSGRPAYFGHSRRYLTECSLRVKHTEGKRYINEKEAKRAIANEELSIVHGFLRERPISPDVVCKEYSGEIIEDIDGPITNQPIGRHRGETFKLPSKITTLKGLCRNFDANYYKYFIFPGYKYVKRLCDILHSVTTVISQTNSPELYYGIIEASANMGKSSKNIRMTELKYQSNSDCKDLYLKITDEASKEHGIDDTSKGRIVLMFGYISKNGIGLCLDDLRWGGELALLPEKYNYLLMD